MSRKNKPFSRLFAAWHGPLLRHHGGMRTLFFSICCFLWLCGARPAAAQSMEPPVNWAEQVTPQLQQLAQEGTRSLGASQAWRIEVQVGALDTRLRLAPCLRIEPYLAPGARLWGRTRVGLRCTQGPTRWNVSLPVTVKVHGRAVVAAVPLAVGTVLMASDLTYGDIDLAEEASPPLADAALAVGRTLQRALGSGEGVRQAHFKPRLWFAVGDTVRVRAAGDGFSVAGEGQALTRGLEGEPARVRTEGGRVLTGLPVSDHRMDVPQ